MVDFISDSVDVLFNKMQERINSHKHVPDLILYPSVSFRMGQYDSLLVKGMSTAHKYVYASGNLYSTADNTLDLNSIPGQQLDRTQQNELKETILLSILKNNITIGNYESSPDFQ